VPGNVLSGRNRGGHALIRDGAKIVETADDIVEELGWTVAAPAPSAQLSNGESAASGDGLLERMQAGVCYDLDELAARAGLEATGLLTRLTALELRGRVKRIEGGRFVRTS
jgi:DNA processing protein